MSEAAARHGFDWRGPEGPLAKVVEEVRELEQELSSDRASRREEELGDLLLAVVNLVRHLGIDPAAALEGSTARFEARLRRVAKLAESADIDLRQASEAKLDELWTQAKKGEARH